MNLKRIDNWHLHLTVEPRNKIAAHTFVAGCEKLGWKPTVIENLSGATGGTVTIPIVSTELLPSTKMHGELGQAIIALHDAAKFWAMSEWLVRRMKIEGRTQTEDAMYAEAHVVLDAEPPRPHGMALSRSLSSGRLYGTSRWSPELTPTMTVEWVIYDSNVAMDLVWFRTWGLMGRMQ